MVRGNWQRRVEQSTERRTAAKLQKEQRRNNRLRSNSISANNNATDNSNDYRISFEKLDEWLILKGNGIGILCEDDKKGDAKDQDEFSASITIDIWTDTRPESRLEYLPQKQHDNDNNVDFNDSDEDYDNGRSRGKGGRFKGGNKMVKGKRGGFKKSKGKSHPNANNKHKDNNDIIVAVGSSRDRSNSTTQQQQKDERLCAKEFYLGKDSCKGTSYNKQQHGGSKKGGRKSRSDSIGGIEDNSTTGCTYQHYHQLPKFKRNHKIKSQKPLTLYQVLHEKYIPTHCSSDDVIKPMSSLPVKVRDAALKASYNANTKGSSCVDMMYHSRFTVDKKPGGIDNDESNSSSSSGDESDEEQVDKVKQQSIISQTLHQFLTKEKIQPTSIVYLTIQGILIYDRHRNNGLVVSDKEEHFLLYGTVIELSAEEEAHLDKQMDATHETAEQHGPMIIHQELTHHLLDEILSYCDDKCVATLPQVCQSWRYDVGTRSPQLWKMLLFRHGWPFSIQTSEGENDDVDVLDECKQTKETFISHYTVVRDVRAIVDACNYMTTGSSGSGSRQHSCIGRESAVQLFKATKGAPSLRKTQDNQCQVKIWSNTAYSEEGSSTRALAAYEDCTLRLFEVVRGGGGSDSNNSIICRQVVNLRPTPSSFSTKKDSCDLVSIDIDDDSVACFIEESVEDQHDDADEQPSIKPWLTVISREDLIVAGNEGLVEDECIQAYDLRASIIDFILGGSDEPGVYDELQESLHNYLSTYEDESHVHISVTPKVIACGTGIFLFHAFIRIPAGLSLDDEEGNEPSISGHPGIQGHRLFLFSSRFGTIIKSLHLERYREGTTLFASRPFKHRVDQDTPAVLCTNILISGPILFMSVEVKRDGLADIIKKSMVESEELAPWSQMCASLTSSYAVYSTDPLQGPVLHIMNTQDTSYQAIEVAGQDYMLHNVCIIHENYVAVIISKRPNEEEEEEFDGQWFGINDSSSYELIVYHISSRQEVYRSPLPAESLSIACTDDTLAANISHHGFVITGSAPRDFARSELKVSDDNMATPGKTKKKKPGQRKKRESKKDGFARGMRGVGRQC